MLRGIPGSKDLVGIKTTLRDLGVEFDVWFSEESLHRWGNVEVALQQLERDGYLTKKDGEGDALFFKAKDAGADDKDRVVRKSDGAYTYFASDIAYFADKISRGYDRLMITLGADHHGYVARVKNALTALGLPSERFEALLYQLVFLYRGGELVKMGKRAGNIITIEEVAEEIDEAAGKKGAGRDALRFFFLSRSVNSNVEFDIELAKKKSLDNPVFYVQYGLRRASRRSLRKAWEIGIEPRTSIADAAWSTLVHPDELELANRASDFPDVLADAAASREPHKVVFYVNELASLFQSYFTRLKTDPILPQASVRAQADWEKSWDFPKTAARLAWVEAIRTVYAAALGLLGVSAPERMGQARRDATEASCGGLDRSRLLTWVKPTTTGGRRWEQAAVRDLEQIQEQDEETRTPRALTIALVGIGGACIAFAVLAMGGRKTATGEKRPDPLGDLIASHNHDKAAASGSGVGPRFAGGDDVAAARRRTSRSRPILSDDQRVRRRRSPRCGLPRRRRSPLRARRRSSAADG